MTAPENAVREVEERLQQGIRMMTSDPQAAMRWLLQLANGKDNSSCGIHQLHSSHRLMFELALALVSTSSMVGASAAPVRVEWSIRAIQTMESVLDVGTPQLASIYASHAAGLMQIIRQQRSPLSAPALDEHGSEKREREILAMSKQCIAALNAAAAIRAVCYGDRDPIYISTRRAVDTAKRELKQND